MSTFFVKENMIYKDNMLVGVMEPSEDFHCTDTFTEKEEGVFEWKRTILLNENVAQDYQNLQMNIKILHPVDFYMIPCVNYNGNNWGDGKEPKGLELEKRPWKFGYHRSSIPAGMYCQNSELAIGVWGEWNEYMGCSCFMSENENKEFFLNLQFPEVEEPIIYCARDQYDKAPFAESTLLTEETIELSATIVLQTRQKPYDYQKFLDTAWNRWKVDSKPVRTRAEVWNLGLEFAIHSAYFRDNYFSGFCMGLTWNGTEWQQKRDYLEIGWVGQNASLAVSFLYESIFTDDIGIRNIGIDILDSWAEKAQLPNGLFRCRFDRIIAYGNDTDNEEEKHDAANLYSAVTEYLDAYLLLKQLGIEKDNYKNVVLGICEFILGVQSEDGMLGKAWYNDGTCSDKDGTVGCYLSKALCAVYKINKEERYLEAIKKSFAYYYQEFITYGYTTAGALDTYCVDKESAMPLLGTALALYEFTKDKDYLEKAVMVGSYLATWQYHYNIPFGEKTLLGKMGYQTRGGTAVSTQHHHIDCYGLEFYEDFIALSKLTGETIWRERAHEIWNNSLYCISDGNLIIKGQRRPTGSQDEGFLQTRWHTKKGEYFGVSEWLVVWNTAFRLKILRKEYLARKREFDKQKR